MASGDVVEPDLLEDGRVVIRSSTVTAAPDAAPGGLAPGLVVNPDGPIARAFDLRPIGMSEVALLDFSRLDSRTRLTVRAEVARLAPGAVEMRPSLYKRLCTLFTAICGVSLEVEVKA